MMKALTLYQPWASLLGLKEKQFETRSWATKYRGPIAIHAAQREPHLAAFPPTNVAVRSVKVLGLPFEIRTVEALCSLPRGCIIAIAELVNVWHIVEHPGTNVDTAKHIPVGAESMTTDKHAPDFSDYFVPTEQEMLFGDWTQGRYAWEFANMRMLAQPIPATGHQRIWNFDETPHLVTIDPWKIGDTKIWTPKGLQKGKICKPGNDDAVSGLEVVA